MPPPAEIVWSAARRPGWRLLAFAILLACLLAAASAWLLHALMPEPDWALPLLLGLALGLVLVGSLAQGAEARLDADGILTYRLRGRDTLRVDLRAVRRVAWVRSALLEGVGLDLDPVRVEILHRKGPSRAALAAQRSGLGLVVLEFLTAEDAARLEALRVPPLASPS